MIHVFCNPEAGSSEEGCHPAEQIRRLLAGDVVVTQTRSAEHAQQAVRDAAADAELVVAVGGDGTVHAVLNGLMQADTRPPLGVIPLGTANNFCRSLGLPLDPLAACRALASGRRVEIDLARVSHGGDRSYFATAASAGNSDRVMDCVTSQHKQTWGAWSYLRCALPVMADLIAFDARFSFDDGPEERASLWNVIVANGQHAASGMRVAPRARLDSGVLDAILIADGTPLDLASLTAEFLAGDYLQDERVDYRTFRKLRIQADPEFKFHADGEELVGQPFEFEVLPGALQVVVPDASMSPDPTTAL
ncbi:Diacylglycerol kinase [Pirellulimonas nuda]|uniref:Diacylglycerol kinase n=1 Tax=Pirellulimonas nuda TaxID=2528009 RepID=A0A518DHQ2_9BACT|nr:diacylglycerol kinase family protein [Pirellulimonas nuda]QDU91009.1 Diacylglycerol kinase [Pirellulimonas nuda]